MQINKSYKKKNLQAERILKLFLSMKNDAIVESGPNLIEITSFLQRHFEVPETANGYFHQLISMRDPSYRTFHITETGKSNSGELLQMNSQRKYQVVSFIRINRGLLIFFLEFYEQGRIIRCLYFDQNSMKNNSFLNYEMVRKNWLFYTFKIFAFVSCCMWNCKANHFSKTGCLIVKLYQSSLTRQT